VDVVEKQGRAHFRRGTKPKWTWGGEAHAKAVA